MHRHGHRHRHRNVAIVMGHIHGGHVGHARSRRCGAGHHHLVALGDATSAIPPPITITITVAVTVTVSIGTGSPNDAILLVK